MKTDVSMSVQLKRWAKQYEVNPHSIFEKRKKNDRLRIPGEEHKKVILEYVDQTPLVVLEQLMERLLQNFKGLKVSKSTVYDFVRTQCNLSLKKARFQPVDTNSVLTGFATRYGWSKKGSPAVVTAPKTRAQTTTVLGAISASCLTKCSLRLPQPLAKKRKRGGCAGLMSTGTVSKLLKAIMDKMDQYPHTKGHYLVMGNAPIHTSNDLASISRPVITVLVDSQKQTQAQQVLEGDTHDQN
ncbi:hypothetical protein VTP01DRAFT_2302 [Rhizomucor pusillus]|uniref:uncharacterized protein n=1 Tax=Rhizomucor pusillus TaxID=4840 RepID=UPI0037430BAF